MHWIQFNRYCASRSQRGEVRRPAGSGIEAAWANTTLIVNNLTHPSGDQPIAGEEDLRERALAALEDAKSQPAPLPWMFGIPEPMWTTGVEPASAVLGELGLQHMMYMTVMECPGPLAEPVRPAPGSDGAMVEFRRALPGSQEAYDALALNSGAYGMPDSVTRDVLDAGAYFADPARDFGFVAYSRGGDRDWVPVSTATVILDLDGWAYVAAVATHADHRQKGYAEAVIRRALTEASPTSGTSLDASRMGQPLYAQMGYQPRFRWNFWIPAAPLA